MNSKEALAEKAIIEAVMSAIADLDRAKEILKAVNEFQEKKIHQIAKAA